MLLCIAQCGMIVLKDEVREYALRTYIKAEDRLRYKGNSYLYLIKIGGGDPYKMVQTERQRIAQKRIKAAKNRLEKNKTEIRNEKGRLAIPVEDSTRDELELVEPYDSAQDAR